MPSVPPTQTLYFAYGSNLWLDQMRRRCPGSTYVGTAILSQWKWIICSAGYANIVPSPDDIVYGMIYTLTPEDEAKLDGYEGVPYNYLKYTLPVKVLKGEGQGTSIDALVYVDVERLDEGPPRHEYIARINHAFKDGKREGIPQTYIDKYIRKFIPK
ncbi:hypothetical protein E4T56_gene15686 [Termitomyces sp. T112]|nr:hypothetical protein E4T56_gene15686 [Termitomyces sp. T112]